MWICATCGRIFEKTGQPHSCRHIPLEDHFKHKNKAKKLFDALVAAVNTKIGTCTIISLPCCVHLFGTYDFLAALPKKESLEIRFTLNRKVHHPHIIQCVPISSSLFKNCLDLTQESEINEGLMNLLNESYHLKNK